MKDAANLPEPSEETTIPPGNRATFGRDRWSILAGLLILFYVAAGLRIAAGRLLWYDEILTTLIARLPSNAAIWQALERGAGMLPPTYYMLVRLFLAIPQTEVAVRLPSLLAMALGLFVVFDCTRRLTDGLHGLIAVSFAACTYLPYYGAEGRPYAIYFLLAALGLWIWIHDRNTKRAAVLFGLVMFAAVAMHYYAILCMVPYVAWEIRNWRPWRLPSAKPIAGVLGICCTVALFSRQIFSMHGAKGDFWSPPALHALRAAYSDVFPDTLLLLALIVLWIAWIEKPSSPAALVTMGSAERVSWFFLFIPLAGYLLAVSVTHAFHNRYFIGMLPGVAVAFACALWRRAGAVRWVSAGVCFILLGFGCFREARLAAHPDLVEPLSAGTEQADTRAALGVEAALRGTPKRFLVFPWDEHLLTQGRYYSRHPEQYVYLLDPGQSAPLPLDLQVFMNLARYYPVQFWKLDDLKIHAHEAVLIRPHRGVLDVLERAGLHATVRTMADSDIDVVSLD